MHIFIVAGEPSGDLLGSRLMVSIRQRYDRDVQFSGIGGTYMAAQGLESLFPLDELAVMGAIEVIPRLRRLLRCLDTLTSTIITVDPDAVITIDASGFNFRLAKRITTRRPVTQHYPLIHMVAPHFWAWRTNRTAKVAALYDHLLTLLPFEPPFFEKAGLKTTFIGHPIIESDIKNGNNQRFRMTHGLALETRVISVLLGSRVQEIRRLGPIFGTVVTSLQHHYPELVVVVPTLPSMTKVVKQVVSSWSLVPIIVDTDTEKYDAFAASSAALACSGTIALELALAGVPAIIAYKLHLLTSILAYFLIKVTYANLVNIMVDRMVVPEFLQHRCVPSLLTQALITLLEDEQVRSAQRQVYAKVKTWLRHEDRVPSDLAAETIFSLIDSH